jgi:hypothetical protein
MPQTQQNKTPLAEVIESAVEWEHSPVGPSAADRWMHCHGSVLATIDVEDVPSQFAIEGTAGHTVTEWAREEGHRAEHYLGRMVPVWVTATRTDMIECDQEMVDAVNYFLDYVETFDGEIYVEEKVSYTNWVDNGFGTCDDARMSRRLGVITDFKYGKGIQVYAKKNAQIMLYALGFYQDYGWLYPELEAFQLNICQPRLDHIDEWTISLEELLKWADEEARPHGAAAQLPGAEYKAGYWCKKNFCRIKETCKTRARTIFESVVGDFEDLDALEAEKLDANILSPSEIGMLLPFLPMITGFCTDLSAHALSELGKGNAIPHPDTGDYKLVAGRTVRKYINNEEETIKLFRKKYKLLVKQFTNSKLMTPPQLEKVIGKKHEIMTELVEKTAGKPVLAPGTDKRPAVGINVETEFDDCSEED